MKTPLPSTLSTPLHSAADISLAKLNHITSGFLNLSLPKDEWSHAAHLVTGLHLIHIQGLLHAEAHMPDLIRSYNIATGVMNTDTEGYHHTLTIFYLRILSHFHSKNKNMAIDDICKKLLDSDLAERRYPLKYYNPPLLFSKQARKYWVAPDLCELI